MGKVRIVRKIVSATVLALPILCILAAGAARGEVEVKVRNFVFDPSNVTIPVGETVKWTWEDGSHTTTNGTGNADPNAGSLWDAVISQSSPTFSYIFTQVGVFPYFCRPHETLGMTGSVTVEPPTGIGDDAGTGGGLPRSIVLSQNYPNPFNPSTTFRVVIPEGGPQASSLRIHDLRGKVVRTVYEGSLSGGEYRFSWDGRSDKGESLPSGIYLYRLEHGDQVVMKKMTLLK